MSASARARVARILSQPTITAEELYETNVLNVGRNGIYTALNNGEIECFRRGKKYVIPTAPLRKKLGLGLDD